MGMTKTQWLERAHECAVDWSEIFWTDAPLVVLDTETTGFGRNDRICEIAMVQVSHGHVVREFHSLINPGRPIPDEASNVHGLTDEDVQDAPLFDDVLDDVLDFLTDDAPWVAHGMAFDARMLKYSIPEDRWPTGVPTLCTLDYAKHRNAVTKMRGHHKLPDLANYFDVAYDPSELHSAMYDTQLLARIIPKLLGGRQIAFTMTKLSHDW